MPRKKKPTPESPPASPEPTCVIVNPEVSLSAVDDLVADMIARQTVARVLARRKEREPTNLDPGPPAG